MNEQDKKEQSAPEKKKHKPAMIPLLRWRSVIALGIGFILGAVGGLGYWILSPSITPATPPAEGSYGFFESMGGTPTGPWSTKVLIQLVNPGSSFMSLRELANKGEYYAAKANSLPFLNFLSEKLTAESPTYRHSADELDSMIRIKFLGTQELPSIEIKATAPSIEESVFLAGFVPKVFQTYLVTEESKKQETEYQNTFKEAEKLKIAAIEAEKELRAVAPKVDNTARNDPAYIALTAKIRALETELNRQASLLVLLISQGYTGNDSKTQEDYENKLKQEVDDLTAALTEAEGQLSALQIQKTASDIRNDPNYITTNAKVQALETELNRQTGILATTISAGDGGTAYTATQATLSRTSIALADARKELVTLEAQAAAARRTNEAAFLSAQAKVDDLTKKLTTAKEKFALSQPDAGGQSLDADTAFQRTSNALAKAKNELDALEARAGSPQQADSPEYKLAKTKVDGINKELSRLTDRLSASLAQSITISDSLDYLAVGKPSLPMPELPDRMKPRNALMMGAIFGMAGAWATINFKWLVKSLSSTAEEKEEEAA